MQPIQHSPTRLTLTSAFAAFSLGMLVATFGGTAFAADIKDGGDLRAALTGEPDVLDPATS